jgi:hypothetical protein
MHPALPLPAVTHIAMMSLLPAWRGEGGRRPDEGLSARHCETHQLSLFVARVSLSARPGIIANNRLAVRRYDVDTLVRGDDFPGVAGRHPGYGTRVADSVVCAAESPSSVALDAIFAVVRKPRSNNIFQPSASPDRGFRRSHKTHHQCPEAAPGRNPPSNQTSSHTTPTRSPTSPSIAAKAAPTKAIADNTDCISGAGQLSSFGDIHLPAPPAPQHPMRHDFRP